MSWIKISDDNGGVYALEPDPDPAVVVSVAEIEAEINVLQAKIDSIHLIEVPEKSSQEVIVAIEKANEFPAGEKIMFDGLLKEKQELLNELKRL